MIVVATQSHLLRRWCADIFASKDLAYVRGYLVCSGSKQGLSRVSAGTQQGSTAPSISPQFLPGDVKLHFENSNG